MAHHSFILVGHNRTAPSGATETNAPHNIDIDVLEMEAMVSALPRVRKLFLSHRPTPMTAIRIRASTRSLSPVLIAKTAIIEIHDNGAGSNAIDAASNAFMTGMRFFWLHSSSLASGNHQSRSNHDQSHANIRRQHFVMMGVHAQMNISGVNAMMLSVWHRDEERQNS
jgi:hypothetical protein